MNNFKLYISLLFCSLFILNLSAQNTLFGVINDQDGTPIPEAHIVIQEIEKGITSDKQGYYSIENLPNGKLKITISSIGYTTLIKKLNLKGDKTELNVQLQEKKEVLDAVDINGKTSETATMLRLKSIEGTAIYASKKNEVINLKNAVVNKSSNNARQIFATVPGVTIWESDCAGLQLGIGARGLSPDRTSNFNTRQNGYDIAADALGYPESYYAPPTQAIDKIEIVRGAASLQYGTQFGGMVNLKLKKGDPNQKFTFSSMNTYNSVGYLNTFNEVGGQIGKLNYYSFVNYRAGSCNRPNTDFYNLTAHLRLGYDITERLRISGEFTHMEYLAQQAGGLTDVQFQQDPYQSLRTRNWFTVDWNLASLIIDYDITDATVLNIRNFALLGNRKALGFIQIPSRQDGPEFSNRDLLVDYYQNFGNESRILHRYRINNQPSAFLVGFRAYRGYTEKQQGFGTNASDANFSFVTEDRNLLSDYDFPSTNFALFSENIFNISPSFSITPGIRLEHINTKAEGFYDSSVRIPLTGQVVIDSLTHENRGRSRNLLLLGIGSSYKFKNGLEIYSNFSQNYRAITFNNLRISAVAYDIDPDLQDEKGFNVELGTRGKVIKGITMDAGLFLLSYNQKIGSVVRVVEDNVGNVRIIRYTTNVADAVIAGLESYVEVDWMTLLKQKNDIGLSTFVNFSHIQGRYYNSQEAAIEGNKVEYVPDWNFKTGVNSSYKNLKASFQFSYLSSQYSDATNAETSASGIYGIIPSYWVMDFSAEYSWKWLKTEFGVNNITDNAYFTRRAIGYPGPGIITSAPRNFYMGLGVSF